MQAVELQAGLVVVDSIASLARKEFPQQTGAVGGAWQRVQLMAGWVARFKALAFATDLVVSSTSSRGCRGARWAEHGSECNSWPTGWPDLKPWPLLQI